MRTVLCKDAHQIQAAVDAPAGARVVRTAAVCLDAELSDGRCPDGGLLCDDVAAMLCTPAGHGWSFKRASCCRTARIDRCKTDGKVKPVRELHGVVALHRGAHSIVQGCASEVHGCRCRRRRECKVHVRTSELRRVLAATEVHGIVAMHGRCKNGQIASSCHAAQPFAFGSSRRRK